MVNLLLWNLSYKGGVIWLMNVKTGHAKVEERLEVKNEKLALIIERNKIIAP